MAAQTIPVAGDGIRDKHNRWLKIKKDFFKNKYVYIMAIPMVVYYLLFHYLPMYGAVIAFKSYSPALGILKSHWIGFMHFENFFKSVYFARIFSNTLIISFYDILFGFPAPILLALLLNEVYHNGFKRIAQTASYLPHFISLMVVCGMIIDFTSSRGVVNDVIAFFGGERSTLLLDPKLFRPIYIISNIWQNMGWNSIIYLAALTSIDPQLYEASKIDGAGRLRQVWHITIPGLIPTITILLILRVGSLMNIGYEKIILLYNSNTYQTADVISSYVYRVGILDFSYSYSTAVGLFNSVINFALLVMTNAVSKRMNDTSLW